MSCVDQQLRIFLRHQIALINMATSIIGCRSHAEDVVQEAYLRFTAAHRDGGAILKPVPYLHQIVRRLAIDWGQANAREKPGVVDSEFFEETEALSASPEQIALYRQQLALVAEALAELPERTRTAFEMHRLGGCTLHDIARRLGISVTLAHNLIHRAMAHCASKLSDD